MTYAYKSYFAMSVVPVSGYFRYRDIFQILPAPPASPRPPAAVGAHPFIIELTYPVSSVGRTTSYGHTIKAVFVNNETAFEKLKHLLLLLTAFTNYRVFLPPGHQGWFVSFGTLGNEQTDTSPQWGQEAYFDQNYNHAIQNFTAPTAPPINEVEPAKYFNAYGRRMDQVLEFPEIITILLDAAHEMSEEAKLVLLSACSLLDQGLALWQEHPSLSFASCVSALESLIAFDHKAEQVEKCDKCGQERFRVMQKFQEFFAKYGHQSSEFRKYAQKIYRYRSKILHRGELFLGDVITIKFASEDGEADRELHRNLIRTCRICIVNWVIAHKHAKPIA